jgi:large subunit ribosomal protein L25
MELTVIEAQLREKVGKSASKKVRDNGMVPCTMYNKQENIQFYAHPLALRPVIYTPDFKIASVMIDGQKHDCILKEVQFHPVNDTLRHVDFLKLLPGATIKLDVPVRFTGTAEGVKIGGKLVQSLRKVRIKTTPETMVTELTVDVSHLGLGQSVRVRDIVGIAGIEILNSPSIPIGTIEIPRALRSAGAKAEKK